MGKDRNYWEGPLLEGRIVKTVCKRKDRNCAEEP